MALLSLLLPLLQKKRSAVPKIADCRLHRLRDTFAVRALLRGIPLEDVSKLLGHQSVAVTEKYYAPWIASRKLRLERLLFETLVDAKGS